MPRMHVVVCVKQIPDPAEPGKLEADHTLDRSSKLILDEADSYGVEMALQLVDKAGGGEVTLVSMAPNQETSGLRTALAMGAAKALLVSDEALSGSGALDTAKVLAAAIKRADPDLVLAATESSDGYTGTVPEMVAALLDLPSVTFAKDIELVDGALKVRRQTEAGYDVVEAPTPAVVSDTVMCLFFDGWSCLRLRLGLDRREKGQNSMSIVVEQNGELYSLIVDSVGEVLSLEGAAYERNPPTLDPRWRDFSDGIVSPQRLAAGGPRCLPAVAVRQGGSGLRK